MRASDPLDRYRRLLALASDPKAAKTERETAIRKLRELEDADPGIRFRWAKVMADEEVKARVAEPPPSQPPPSGPSPHVRPLDPVWAAWLDGTAGRWGGLFTRAAAEVGPRVESWAAATVEDLTGAALLSLDSYLNDLEAIVRDFTDSDPFDTWSLEGKKIHRLLEKHLAMDEDETGVFEGDDDEGDIARLCIELPVGLLAAIAGDPAAAQAFAAELLEIVGDALEGDDDDDDDE